MSIISSITNDIFIRTLTNITTSLITTHSLFVWFVDYNNNDYNIYKKEIKLTDIHNKLLIISSLIKCIVKKYYTKTYENIDSMIEKFIDETTDKITKENFILHRPKRKMRQNKLKIKCLTLYNENKVK
jgi:hypothetical protein